MSSGEASPSSRDSTNIFLPIGVNSTQLGQPELVIDTGIDIDKLIGSLVISLQAAQVASMELQRQSDHAETERVDAELALAEARQTETVTKKAAINAATVVNRISTQIEQLREIRDESSEARGRYAA